MGATFPQATFPQAIFAQKWLPAIFEPSVAFDLSALKNRGHILLDPTERESEDFTLGQPEATGHR